MTVEFTKHTINIDGDARTYWAYLPPKPWRGAIIGLHGSGGTGKWGEQKHFAPQARRGFACVFPTSLVNPDNGRRQWALYGGGYLREEAFIDVLRARLIEESGGQVGILGNSSGGYMVWRLRTLRPAAFAWFAPGAANLPKQWAPSLDRAPTYVIHGTADRAIPFNGDTRELGWRQSLRAVACANAGGVDAFTLEEIQTVQSAHGKTTTLVRPAESSVPRVPVGGARINGGGHAWHAGPRWQAQQRIIEWADAHHLWHRRWG